MIATIAAFAALSMAQSSLEAPSRQVMTREIVRACMAQVSPDIRDPEPACACTAGWLSAQLDYRDFYVVGRIYHFATDPDGMQGEITRLIREGGYSRDDILRVSRFLQDSEDDLTAACGFLER